MDFNDATALEAQGSKIKRVGWPHDKFHVIGDPVSQEDQAALDWVESSFVESVNTPPQTQVLGDNMPALKVKEIKPLNVHAKVKGQDVEVDRIISVTLSSTDADVIYDSEGKNVSIEGMNVAAEVTGDVEATVVVEGVKKLVAGKIKPFQVIAADDVVIDPVTGQPAVDPVTGQPVPPLALEAEVA